MLKVTSLHIAVFTLICSACSVGNTGSSVLAAGREVTEQQLERAYKRLNRTIETVPYSPQTQAMMRNFQMASWGSPPSGNLEDYMTPERAAKRAAELKATGVTVAITSGRQNRFNHLDMEDEIVERQRIVAEACHEQGLAIFDHVDLTIYWQSSFPEFFKHPDWAQQDLRDGTPIKWLCLNNPGYRAFYAKYLQKLVAAGLDGFMLDEISFHDQLKQYCGCEHCRAKFEKDTGIRFPEYWDDKVINNRDNPLWQLWRAWQRNAIVEFQAFLVESMRQVNPEAVLVSYSTTVYRTSVRAGDLEQKANVCFIGTEGTNTVFAGYINLYSQHRILSTYARHFGRPSWAHYPADNAAEYTFSAWHSTLTNSGLWAHSIHLKHVYTWDHWPEASAWGQPVGDVGVVLTTASRDGNMHRAELHIADAIGWTQALGSSGVQFDLVTELHTDVDKLNKFKAIVLPYPPSMTEGLIKAVRKYVRQGGTAIISGDAGRYDRLGFLQGKKAMFRKMGFKDISPAQEIRNSREKFVNAANQKLELEPGFLADLPRLQSLPKTHRFNLVLGKNVRHRVLAEFADGKPAIVSIPRGKGRYIILGFTPGQIVHQPRMHRSSVWQEYLQPDVVAMMKGLANLATDGKDLVDVQGSGILSASYRADDRVWVRMLNTSGGKFTVGERVGNPAPNFPELDPITIRTRLPLSAKPMLFTPSQDEPLVLTVETRGDVQVIIIPGGAFEQYAFVRMEISQ